ncbi:MAG: 16S rRNA (guanine(527)-N(7))-methyltransferase RsmG [Candidatus Faecousia sp.]|jgi:16S rRNA (guanine527-N7)-methyltransferase|nr:16S rRNA (guanine(527)-N(7))-methyltransferase RsmG [Oscillospiraceae bacterium]MBQ1755897.1 16S rRNA (guanine(527)-N(7))-methyltransferase RsmG [Oscillospiraceae bacterium]MEE3460176.1 16S rRNA (guanine(527)-N(7))-methyltransferase RsmG [Candidatus Faecousia sp.]
MKPTLQSGLSRLGVELPDETVDRLVSFGEAVLEKNRVMNLTAITDPDQAAELHLLDSLTLLKVLPLAGKSLLDVGTGAGFPGVPLKLAVPSLRLTLLDSLQKRMRWLEDEALPALDLEARFLSGRAEEFAAQYRERFDVVTSRAVARLNLLCELCLPYVHEGGYFLAMKGAQAGEELTEAAKAIRTLGGSFERTETFEIGGAAHTVVVIRKTAHTPPQYPRAWSRIKQKPL